MFRATVTTKMFCNIDTTIKFTVSNFHLKKTFYLWQDLHFTASDKIQNMAIIYGTALNLGAVIIFFFHKNDEFTS
jgi:hypothetical protein